MGRRSNNVGFDSYRTTTRKSNKGGNSYYSSGNGRYGSGYGGGYGYDDGYGGDYEDYYGSYYNNNFSWGNFSYGSLSEDDDKDLVIKSHPSYFTPKSSDISYKLDYAADTKENRDLIKEMSRFFYYKMLEERDYFDEKYDDLGSLGESEIAMIASKQKFYDELWEKFIPGISPLEKALFFFKEMERKSGGPKKRYTPEDLERASEEINISPENYADPIYNELLDENMFTKTRKFDILNKIAMIKNFGSEFKIQKEVEEKIVSNSHITAHRMMRDYSQMHNIELYQRLMPNFNTKLLTKDVIVRVPVDRTEHKQKIIMLLDYSGSMNEEDKQQWVVALMVDRLKYVMKEEAEIFFSHFLSDKNHLHFTHVYDRKSALEFWSKFSTRPSGGNTELGDMVNYINSQINEHHRLHNLSVDLSEDQPEILAINDGNDSVDTDRFTYKTNAISLRQSNSELKGLCIENKGKYVVIQNDRLTSYNIDGEQTTRF